MSVMDLRLRCRAIRDTFDVPDTSSSFGVIRDRESDVGLFHCVSGAGL